MRRLSRLTASAALGGLALLVLSTEAGADGRRPAPVGRPAASRVGSILGVVQDESGAPVVGALVSVVGVTRAVAVTDRTGRFELLRLSPGGYALRAHSSGFAASNTQTIDVRPGRRISSSIALRRTAAPTSTTAAPVPATPLILQAGVGLPMPVLAAAVEQPPAPSVPRDEAEAPGKETGNDDHSELTWRLRRLRRSVLQEATGAGLVGDPVSPGAPDVLARAVFGEPDGSPVAVATNFFAGTPFSGELNLLTTSSFNTPQQLFSGDLFARNVAYASVGAPAGGNADWSVRAALSQADISAWVLAGTYSTRGPARHHFDIGLSYATQRYDGGNPAALRGVSDGSRNAGAIYGFDTWTFSPAVALTVGGRYARYDYLESQTLVSPRVSLALSPSDHARINATASRRSIAPGAEEFLPPGDAGLWLPPQRTFSSFANGRSLEAEHTTHVEVEFERDLGSASTVSVSAFQQYVTDQILTVFGLDMPGQAPANLGHYFVGSEGDVDTRGLTAGVRTALTDRVRASVGYSLARAQWKGADDLGLWVLRSSSETPLRANQIHAVATSVEADVPETSTRVAVLYRISSSRHSGKADYPLDTRFDVQVHQSLPFMDFSTAKWEMLVGVRNFFRESAPGQSVFDELLVVRPPKRIVGGLTMRF